LITAIATIIIKATYLLDMAIRGSRPTRRLEKEKGREIEECREREREGDVLVFLR